MFLKLGRKRAALIREREMNDKWHKECSWQNPVLGQRPQTYSAEAPRVVTKSVNNHSSWAVQCTVAQELLVSGTQAGSTEKLVSLSESTQLIPYGSMIYIPLFPPAGAGAGGSGRRIATWLPRRLACVIAHLAVLLHPGPLPAWLRAHAATSGLARTIPGQCSRRSTSRWAGEQLEKGS